jgi:hypothetical protein
MCIFRSAHLDHGTRGIRLRNVNLLSGGRVNGQESQRAPRATLMAARIPHPKNNACPVAPRAHPLARRLFEIAADEKTAITDIADRSGVSLATLVKWKYRHAPTVVALEAALNVLGCTLAIRRKGDDAGNHESGAGGWA